MGLHIKLRWHISWHLFSPTFLGSPDLRCKAALTRMLALRQPLDPEEASDEAVLRYIMPVWLR